MDAQTANTVAHNAHRRSIRLSAISFVVCIVALFASAIIMGLQFHWGAMFWATIIFGAVVISILLTAVFLPFLKEVRSGH